MNFQRFGGRRFGLSAASMVINAALLWFGKLSPDAYAIVVSATVAAYIAGGTMDHVKGRAPKEPQ